MAEQTIMLNCSAGMSTSLLVTKMQAAAKVLMQKSLLAQHQKLTTRWHNKKSIVYFLGLK